MPKRTIILLLLLIIVFTLTLLTETRLDKRVYYISSQGYKGGTASLPERPGEEIIYDIKLGGITLGRSSFNFASKTELNGRQVNLIIFKTRLAQFSDTERIYSDPDTVLPVKVERDIFNWSGRETITEEYDQEGFSVTIYKKKWLGESREVIKKNGVIHNAVLLPHYIRNIPNLTTGQEFTVNLPNSRFLIKLASIEYIDMPTGRLKTYHFTSTPKQVEIWISADERRIPVIIQGVGTYGYMLVMKEYKGFPQKNNI